MRTDGRGAATWLVVFFGVLHLLVLRRLVTGAEGRIAEAVAVASVIPVVLALLYLAPRLRFGLTWLDWFVFLYAGWSVSSLLLYLQPDNPSGVAAYGVGLYHLLLPIACYFAIKHVPERQHPRVLTGLLLLNGLVVVLGLILHVTRPQYYIDFLSQSLADVGYTEEWQFFARLQSYLGSTTTGYVSAVSMVLITTLSRRVQRWLPVLVPLFLAAAALTLQRGAIVGAFVALVYLAFFVRGDGALRVVIAVLLIVGVAYGAQQFVEGARFVQEILQERVTTDMAEGITRVFAERGYGAGFRYLESFPLGVGLGGTSSAATTYGMARMGQVADANFMRIAADLGVVGLLLFLLVVGFAARGAWHSRHRAAWMTFLIIHCGIMLTTNVLDSFYVSHCFWLILGIIDGDRAPEPVPLSARDPGVVPVTAYS